MVARVVRGSASLTLAFTIGAAYLAVPTRARAEGCQVLSYSFQPDCFRAPEGTSCLQSVEHLDLRPQFAVWLAKADKTLVDTLKVTNLTAKRGIGNRPGRWDFLSAPKFPYGRRVMALPIWAHARGKLYDTVVMQESGACSNADCDNWLGWHEATSSMEPYFCVPLPATGQRSVQSAIDGGEHVDAISCPSVFNSSKGRLTSTKSYYPPRDDLDPAKFVSNDCDTEGGSVSTCTISASRYETMNDLDAVAAATPPYGQVFSDAWTIPGNLPAGDYIVFVEVNKEYDTNGFNRHDDFQDPRLVNNGIRGNIGQPSVLFQVPIHLDGASTSAAATTQIAGYGDWRGESGDISPRDENVIATNVLGSGEERLLEITGPTGTGRVHVAVDNCEDACSPLPPPPSGVTDLEVSRIDAFSADISFTNAGIAGQPVSGYEIRYRAGSSMSADQFMNAIPAQMVQPGPPGTKANVTVDNLKPATDYTIGVRSVGLCMEKSEIVTVAMNTTAAQFTRLSGCFVATAAYGSELEPHVSALRAVRDRLRDTSALFAAGIDLYERSGPAAAALIRKNGTARAVVRRMLAPLASVAEAAIAVAAASSSGR